MTYLQSHFPSQSVTENAEWHSSHILFSLVTFHSLMVTCRHCKEDKPDGDFAPHAKKLKACKACSRNIIGIHRGKGNPAKRMLFNFKQTCRARGIQEGTLWRLEHVQKLIETCELPPGIQAGQAIGMQPKLRIVHVDKSKPWLPDNARIDTF